MRSAEPDRRPREQHRGINRRAGRTARRAIVWPVLVVIVGALLGLAGATGLTGSESRPTAAAGGTAASPVPTSQPPTRSPSPVPGAAGSSSAAPVLRLSGPVPPIGPGTFSYDRTTGPVLGRAGTLRRVRIAVEQNIEAELAGLSAAVDATLGNAFSWTGGGRVRFQRVPPGIPHEFTVYLVTAGTALRMCAAGGVNIRINGQPYTSCRASGKVIINLDRWRLSVPDYVATRVPLAVYRSYVINHEVGHQLGNGHERCPGRGRPAPVMMKQTLGLDGCVANPWPYLNGQRYVGPVE